MNNFEAAVVKALEKPFEKLKAEIDAKLQTIFDRLDKLEEKVYGNPQV